MMTKPPIPYVTPDTSEDLDDRFKVMSGWDQPMALTFPHMEQFEALALSQRPAPQPWTPVTDYTYEGRKAAEGRHPRLILDTFQPDSILDVGCGPGHLVVLLNDLKGHTIAFGADKQGDPGYVLDIASPVRIASRFDLVICREVLEHLTLLEIRNAIANLCRLSKRFVYVTTRFSSEHDLLRVETHDDLDPTHITLASKDLLRLLFVLEGFRRRADLETEMDWQQKGRCLVYERV